MLLQPPENNQTTAAGVANPRLETTDLESSKKFQTA